MLRHLILVILALAMLAIPATPGHAQASDAPAVTSHSIDLGGRALAYVARAGLMPIRSSDGAKIVGDMSYVAYSVKPKTGEMRPIVFAWNGGPGGNSSLLHYGAFGPRRVAGDHLEPNPVTLLGAADLVFIDQIETGFGRIAADADRDAIISARGDVLTFAAFIETWLRDIEPGRPVFLVGESYGVYRAIHVAHALHRRGVDVDGLVLISGGSIVLPPLGAVAKGVTLFPGLAALAFERDRTRPEAGTSALEVYDNAYEWARWIRGAAQDDLDRESAKTAFLKGLDLFGGDGKPLPGGVTIADQGVDQAFELVGLLGPDALQLPTGDLFDVRKRPGALDKAGLSPAIVDDLRTSLKFDPPRVYRGQEPEDGKPARLINFNAYWPIQFDAKKETWPSGLMAVAPKLRLFFASGIFDARFACAHIDQGVRRDLASYRDRVREECYVGGHMMYEDPAVSAQLSADVLDFMREKPVRP